MKKTLIIGMALFLAAAAWAGQAVPSGTDREGAPAGPALMEQKDSTKTAVLGGSAILDLFMESFREMAQRGTSAGDLDKRLQEIMQVAKKSREANAIDAVFFFRFNRLLAVTKLVIVPDATGILAPVIDEVLDNFVLDKLGTRAFREAGGKGPGAIGTVAEALSVELIDLQIYLDTAKERADLKKKLDGRMSEPTKK